MLLHFFAFDLARNFMVCVEWYKFMVFVEWITN